MKKTFKSIVLSVALTISSVLTVTAATNSSNDFYNTPGSLDGYSYTISLSGTSLNLHAATQYSKSNCGRSVSVTGTYIGSSFVGTKTKTNSMGGANGQVSTGVSVSSSSYERFVTAKATHTINGWVKESATYNIN